MAIAVLAAALFALRLAAPPNLRDQDQERPAGYVLDAVKNGHWLCQRDLSGDIASKPPLWTWLSALTTLACGRLGVFSLYLPGALALFGTGCLIFAVGRKHFGTRAAGFSVLALFLTTAGLKGFGLARTDAVFAFLVTASALLAFRAWMLGRGWMWFWLLAAATTLTKGPLGVVLAAAGLVACYWERTCGEPWPLRGSMLPGLGLFLLVVGGWFGLAYVEFGHPLVAKMLGKELVAKAVSDGDHHYPGMLFYQPPLYYLGRAAPWSLFALYGLWRVWRRPNQANRSSVQPAPSTPRHSTLDTPPPSPLLRRFERFLFCWFLLGLTLFSFAPHQRADLLWPLMPAGALLAGHELARLTEAWRTARLCAWFGPLVALALAGFAFYYFGPRARQPLVQETVALKALATALETQAGAEFPLTHVDDPMTLQVYLNTLRPQVSRERAIQLLAGPEPAFVAVKDLEALNAAARNAGPRIYNLLPSGSTWQPAATFIIGNRPEVRPTAGFACCFGPLFVRAHGARLREATEREFGFEPLGQEGEALITNESGENRLIRVRVTSGERPIQQRSLAPGETWHVPLARGGGP